MKRSEWAVAITGTSALVALAIGLGTYVLAQGPGGGLDSETAERLLNPPNPFPEVAAAVDGHQISGTALARRAEIMRINYENTGSEIPNEDQLVAEALDSLVADELLAQAAKERGLWPPQEEVVALAVKIKESTLQFPPGSAERKAADTLWEGQGIVVDEIDSNPAVLEDLARALAIARIKSEVGRKPPPGYPMDMNAYRSAIKDFTESLLFNAAITVYVLTPGE